LGLLFPIYGNKKIMFQTTNQIEFKNTMNVEAPGTIAKLEEFTDFYGA